MMHTSEVTRVLKNNDFPIEKIVFSSEKKNYALLAIGSEKQMIDFRARVRKSTKTIIFIQDEAPTFYPAIKGNYFDMVKVVFE